MLRTVQVTNTQEIVKSSNNKTGESSFYGVRDKGAMNKPFDETFSTLGQAREFAGVVYNPPVRETMSKADHAERQAKKSRKR